MVVYIYKMNIKDKFYIGSTKDINDRIKRHKSNCYFLDNRHYNYKVYKYIRENCSDWSEVSFDIIDVYDDISSEFKFEIEDYYMQYFSNNLNMVCAKFSKEKKAITDKLRKEKGKEKVHCECGRVVCFAAIGRHRKSKIHQKLLNK